MESNAKFLAHPLHQILIVFPLGLLSTSVVFDYLGRSRKRKDLSQTGYWMAASGVATGAIAAVPGVIDYLAIPARTRAKNIGWLHGVGNAIVLGLFTGSLAARKRRTHEPTAASTAMSLTGVALAMGTGWLGGELVDRLGVGVSDHAHLNASNSLRG